jgi:hypothetical protein
MGYSCYQLHGRDQGYGVPCKCDHPDCDEEIHRGIAFACGGNPMENCGLFFCNKHRSHDVDPEAEYTESNSHEFGVCERCAADQPAFDPKPDIQEWIDWKLTDESWSGWRAENPDWVAKHQQTETAK